MLLLMSNVIVLTKRHKVVQLSILFAALIALLLSLLSGFSAGFIILGNYFFGVLVCSVLLQYQAITFPLICDFTKQWKKANSKTSEGLDQVCNVCTGSRCRRYLKQDKTPWKSIRIQKKLNDAAELLFNTILNEFIASWYGEFTSDLTFVSSLRNSIRQSVSVAVNKVMHLDTGKVIADKLLPCAIRHIDDYLCMERIARLKNIGIEQVAIGYLGGRLHVAATNRDGEVEYLRQVSALLLPALMPLEYMRCDNFAVFMRELFSMWILLPLMDVLADPNVINHLVILAVHTTRSHRTVDHDHDQDHQQVELLHHFGERHSNSSPFALELRSILKDTELLFAFMQFLKKEDKVHLLQFVLDLEEFNSALLRPDLSPQQLIGLHKTATELQRRNIGCDQRQSLALRRLLAGGPEQIVRLRTTEPLLFAAADHVYGLLERDWLQHFHHTVDFYKYLTTSTKITSFRAGSAINQASDCGQGQLQGERGTVSRISSGLGKIKGVLAARAPVEGAPFCNAQAIHVVESQQQQHLIEQTDTSSWKVSIPTVTTNYQQKELPKHEWIFHVQVEFQQQHNDDNKIGKRDIDKKMTTLQCIILRKEQDFHALTTKLYKVLKMEQQIPARPARSAEERRRDYEQWLRHLLAQHGANNSTSASASHVVRAFLTQPDSSVRTGWLPDKQPLQQDVVVAVASSDLETIYQSVAMRLRKEKGQHLDTSFMGVFLKSTGQAGQHNTPHHRSKHKLEWADLSDAMDVVATPIAAPAAATSQQQQQQQPQHVPKTLHSHVFNDNFGFHSQSKPEATMTTNTNNGVHPKALSDSLFYLLKHILKVRVFCLRMLACLCSVAQGALESAARHYISHKIRLALNQDNLIYLIAQLQEVIFTKSAAATSEQLEERKRDAFKHLSDVIPDRLAKLLSSGGTEIRPGVAKLLHILHNPHLNKHLAYNLLDLILLQLYPELDKAEHTTKYTKTSIN